MNQNLIEMAKTKHLLPIALLVCVSAVVYFNSLSNGFVYDDLATIVENTHIKRFGNYLSSFYTPSYFKISGGEASYRPVATLSYYLLYAVFDVNPFGYHLASVVLHIFNVILVYLMAHVILNRKGSAVMVGLLFACHPVNTEAVNAISYNEDLIAAFFYFLALLLYMKLETSAPNQNLLFLTLSLFFFLLGLLSKEMAITLPAIVVLYDLTLREPASPKISINRVLEVVQERKYAYIGFLGVSLFYLWLRFFAFYNPEEVETQIWGRLIDRVIYLPVLFFKYIKLSLFPLTLNADYVFSYPTRFFDVGPVLAVVFVLALIVFSLLVFSRSKTTSFGIWWFLVTLFPVYNLIQIYNPFAERYLYIPLFGLCLVVAIFLEFVMDRFSFTRSPAIKVLIILCIVVFYSIISINRNKDWKDSFSLWTKTLEVEPNSFRAHGNLARVYQEKGLLEASLREVKKTMALNPKDYKAYYNLGVVLGKQGIISEAIAAYKKTIEMNPQFKNAHFNLGNIYKTQNRMEEARRAYQKVVQIDPADIEARNNLGVIYAMQGELDAAIIEWQQVMALDPENRDVQDNIEKAKRILDQQK
jgi:tetratricopeptide (TPR) repeat protein